MEITLGNWIIYEILFYPGILKESGREKLCFFRFSCVDCFFFLFAGRKKRSRNCVSIKFLFYSIRDACIFFFFCYEKREGEHRTFLKGIFPFHFSARKFSHFLDISMTSLLLVYNFVIN